MLEKHFLNNPLIFQKIDVLKKLIHIILIYLEYERLSENILNMIKQLIYKNKKSFKFLCNFIDNHENQDSSDTLVYLLTDYINEKQGDINNDDFQNQLIFQKRLQDNHDNFKQLIIQGKILTWQDWHDNQYKAISYEDTELICLMLNKIIFSSNDKNLKLSCIYKVAKCNLFSHPSVITKIIDLFIGNPKSDIRYFFIHALQDITDVQQLRLWIVFLKEYTQDTVFKRDPDLHYIAYSIIWHCAQYMSYPEFYHAWHSQPPKTHPELPDNLLN